MQIIGREMPFVSQNINTREIVGFTERV